MRAEDFFLKLLQSGLYGGKPEIDASISEEDWGWVWETAKSQTVTGLIADAIGRMDKSIDIPANIKNLFFRASLQNLQRHLHLNKALADTVSVMREHGIEGVLLKGQGLALNYTTPSLRQCGDVDFYTGPNYEKSCEIGRKFLENGHHAPYDDDKHFVVRHNGVTVEIHQFAALHSIPSLKKDFQRWIQENLDDTGKCREVCINGVDVYLPPIEFDLIYVFYHAWYHFLNSGVGLRQICDWVLLIDKFSDSVDQRKITCILEQFKLLRGWNIFGWIAVNKLGLAPEKIPAYDDSMSTLGRRAFCEIMRVGNFGHHDESLINPHQLKGIKRKLATAKNMGRIIRAKGKYSPLEVLGRIMHQSGFGVHKLLK